MRKLGVHTARLTRALACVCVSVSVFALVACRHYAEEVLVSRIIAPVPAMLFVSKPRNASASLQLTVADRTIRVHCRQGSATTWVADSHLPQGRVRDALTADNSGDRVAFRCASDDPWSIVYRGMHYAIAACNINAPPGPIDWSHVPTLEEAYVPLLSCPELVFDNLRTAADEHGGIEGLGRLVSATAFSDLAPNRSRAVAHDAERDWLQSFGESPAGVQSEVRSRLRAALLEGGSSGPMVRRAATVVDLTDPAFTAQILGARMVHCTDLDATDGCAMLLRRWSLLEPRAASEFTCANLPSEWTRIGPTALAAIAHGGTHCAAFAADHERDRCARLNQGTSCTTSVGSHPCTLDEQRAEVAAELGYRIGTPSPWASDPTGHTSRLHTSAAMASGVACMGTPSGPM